MYNYSSDATKFLNQYLKDHPEAMKKRLENRSLLWEVEVNPREQARFRAAHSPRKPYAYD